MKNTIITINSANGKVKASQEIFAVAGEHLQGNLIIEFDGEFIDGTAVLEFRKDSTKNFISLTKEGYIYRCPIIDSLVCDSGPIDFQVKITQEATEDGTPVFKSSILSLTVAESINAEKEVEV